MTVASAATRGLSLLAPTPKGVHPAWLSDARRAAFDWATERGFPTLKDEDWKYTRLEPLLDVPFEPSVAGASPRVSSHTIAGLGADLGGTRLVFVNGHFVAELSRMTKLAEGVTVTSLGSVLAEEAENLEPFFSGPSARRDHAFSALNAAFADDGAFIQVSADTIVDEPIELVFFGEAGLSPVASSPRSIVLAGARSRMTIVEIFAGTPGDVYLTNSVTEVVLEEGAQVEHYKIQDEPDTAFHLGLLAVHQGRASRFSSHSVTLGSSIARHEVRVKLEAEGAEVSLNGLYVPRGDQLHDNPILIEHAAPGCTSRQLYKGIADERGHGVFNGHIIVSPDASGTDASQTNKNLLLSGHAEIDTRPRLEIFTDDVKCTHGAAVGALDEEALFYLRSRGMPLEAARALLTFAFAREMLDLIPSESLRSYVETLVAGRLSTVKEEVAK